MILAFVFTLLLRVFVIWFQCPATSSPRSGRENTALLFARPANDVHGSHRLDRSSQHSKRRIARRLRCSCIGRLCNTVRWCLGSRVPESRQYRGSRLARLPVISSEPRSWPVVLWMCQRSRVKRHLLTIDVLLYHACTMPCHEITISWCDQEARACCPRHLQVDLINMSCSQSHHQPPTSPT